MEKNQYLHSEKTEINLGKDVKRERQTDRQRQRRRRCERKGVKKMYIQRYKRS